MSAPIDFYFDFSSPYGYLASERIDELAEGIRQSVLESEGRMQEALSAYTRGRWFFPLSPHLREAAEQIRDRSYRMSVLGG